MSVTRGIGYGGVKCIRCYVLHVSEVTQILDTILDVGADAK